MKLKLFSLLSISAIGTIFPTDAYFDDWSKMHNEQVGTPTHWELFAYDDLYNRHVKLVRLNKKYYFSPEECAKDAEKLDPPPPPQDGHIYGYICHKVEGRDGSDI